MTETSSNASRSYFFCGIGGSGMLPLAVIVKGLGNEVAGSDRSRDQGRTPEKFDWLEARGFTMFPQDGSGITSAEQVLVASAAVEDTVPDAAKAKELGCIRQTRAELLSTLFNQAHCSLAIGGTSGKSTTTAMLGWILSASGREPTIMNGAVMKNFVSAEEPFASAVVGDGDVFVSEVDESDGSIALYRPSVAVLLNVSLDHKSMAELRELFGNYLAVAKVGVVNFDDLEAAALADRAEELVSFGLTTQEARIGAEQVEEGALGISAVIVDREEGTSHPLALAMPGLHNLSNALAAIAGAVAAGLRVDEAVEALASFKGLARRFDIVGTTGNGITVIDDFGHNPEKCRATLKTLKSQPGRVLAFFQPHGYGPLRQMGHELAQTFAEELGPEDHTVLCDPVYFGGTVDRSQGSERIVDLMADHGASAEHIPSREDCGERLRKMARPGDRIVVMGARDDTLTLFAQQLFAKIEAQFQS